MTRVYSVASRASRRIFIRDLVAIAGPALAIGAAAAVVVAIMDRLIGPGLAWWLVVPAAIVVPLIVAFVLAWLRRGSRLAALSTVDQSLRLEDRLGSALSLAQRADEDPFAHLAVQEGERAASEVRIDRAIPVRFGNAWVAWGVLTLLALGALVYVEPMHLLRDDAAHDANIQRIAQQEQAADEIQDIAGAIDQLSTDADPALADTPGAKEALAELENLRQELARGETDADSARSEAAQSLNDLADGLEESARESQSAHDAVREMFSKLPPPDAPDNPADRLAEALRSGDLDRALDALDELERSADELPPEQREQAARDLRDLADDLEKLARHQQDQAQNNPPEPDQPDETGLTPEQRDELREMGDRQQIEDALRERGFDEEPARKLAEQLEQEQQQREAQQNAQERSNELSDAARDAANEIEQQPEPPADQNTPNETPQDDTDQNNPDAPGAPSPTQAPTEQPGEQNQPEQQPQQQPGQGEQPQPQQQPQQQPGQGEPAQQPDPGEQGEQPGNQPGNEPGDQPNPQPGTQENSTPQPGESSPSRGAPQPGEDAEQSTPQRDPQSAENNQNEGDPAPGETSEGEPQGEGGSGVERLREQIKDLRDQADRAKRQQDRARDIRERARELLDGMSEEERQRTLDWAQQLADEQGQQSTPDPLARNTPPDDAQTTPLDLRKPGEDGRVIGEFNDPNARPGAGDISDRAPTPAEIREALQGLDQLVEDRAVPRSRQRVIERYFRKALERAENQQSPEPEPASPPPTPARDAGG